MTATPPYLLTALDLRGRRVVIAGAGSVVSRRIDRYLDAGAAVEVIAPAAAPHVESLAHAGRLTWTRRAVAADDVEGAWFVMAATDSAPANGMVARECERRRIFCIRADDADDGTARTPTHLAVDGFWVGVIGHRDPAGARALRRRIADALGVRPPG